MTENQRKAQWVADSGYLICFGAVPNGRDMLYKIFDGGVAATPTVRWELERIARDNYKARHVKMAANQFAGKHSGALLDLQFESRDEPERDTALDHISRNVVPKSPPAPLDDGEDCRASGTEKHVEHGGEAEAIAVALRAALPLLMTDRMGATYARARRIKVEPFAESLRRLSDTHAPNDLWKICRDVGRRHDVGAVVSGPLFFQVPPPSKK